MNTQDMTISERLAAIGIDHFRDAKSQNDYRHSFWKDGEFIGRFDAKEAVEYLNKIEGYNKTAI